VATGEKDDASRTMRRAMLGPEYSMPRRATQPGHARVSDYLTSMAWGLDPRGA